MTESSVLATTNVAPPSDGSTSNPTIPRHEVGVIVRVGTPPLSGFLPCVLRQLSTRRGRLKDGPCFDGVVCSRCEDQAVPVRQGCPLAAPDSIRVARCTGWVVESGRSGGPIRDVSEEVRRGLGRARVVSSERYTMAVCSPWESNA
jgi:hypothetical protein